MPVAIRTLLKQRSKSNRRRGRARHRKDGSRLRLESLEIRSLLSANNPLGDLTAISVTQLTSPTPGPMQVAVDFNEALPATAAETVANYKIASQGGIGLPIQSAAYSDGAQHRVVLSCRMNGVGSLCLGLQRLPTPLISLEAWCG
jgi:hypothetical protein